MPKPSRSLTLSLPHVALAWMLALLAWMGLRAMLAAFFSQPFSSPGLVPLLGLLAVAGWATVEEPRLGAGQARLALAWLACLLALGSGEALLYADMPGKDAIAPAGFGLLLLGAGLAWSRGRGRTLGLASGGLLLLLGLSTFLRRAGVAWDLFQGPVRGQWSLDLFWILLAGGLAALAWQASQWRLSLAGPPLSRKQEALGLLAILAVGALLRFWRPAALPAGWWYDEVNLARAVQDGVLATGRAPLYVGEQVENPGAWLWVGAAIYRAFGVSLGALRVASGAFGLLAVLPLWALARLWLGGRWALVAAFLFATMRWVLIPQRIAFMSGFALFWMLAAFWGLWWAWLRGGAWRWLLAGLLLGANLHTYTPARLVPVVAAAFLGLQLLPGLRRQGPRLGAVELLALAGGFLLSAGPMLWYLATHWADYSYRAKEVSIFTDVAKTHRPLLAELWGTTAKHLLMFHYRGDFNARHNLHFLPHVDFLSACALALAAPLLLGQALRDARARFLLLWVAAMLAAGALTLPVEAPQGHRTVLAAPALALALALALPTLWAPLRAAFGGAWPQTLRALGLGLLLAAGGLNAYELLVEWPVQDATFRSFSPRASAILREVTQSRPGTLVAVSNLPNEYQFLGYEWGVFVRFGLRQQNRAWVPLRAAGLAVPADTDGQATRSVLLFWGDSDPAITSAVQRLWPDLAVHREPQPFPAAGEPAYLYLSAEIPYERVPPRPAKGPLPLLYRLQP